MSDTPLTLEQMQTILRTVDPKTQRLPRGWEEYGRAIEAATAAKYAERIADLQAKLDEGTPWQAEQIAGLLDITKDLQAKLDAATVDADRYRLLRKWSNVGPLVSKNFTFANAYFKHEDELDAAIDAMKEASKT